MKKLLVVVLALAMVFALASTVSAEDGAGTVDWELDGNSVPTSIEVEVGEGFTIEATVTPTEEDETAKITDIAVSVGTLDSISGKNEESQTGEPATCSATCTFGADDVGAKTVTFTITYTVGEVSGQTNEKNITVYVGDNEARLESLTLSATGPSTGKSTFSSSSFGSSKGNYMTVNLTGHVDLGATGVTVAAVARGEDATVTVDGDRDNKYFPLEDDNDLTFNVVVTAQNGRTKTYAVTIKQDWDVAKISTLKIEGKTVASNISSDKTVTYYYPYGSKDGDKLEVDLTYTGFFDGDDDDYVVVGTDDDDYLKITGGNANGFTIEFIDDPADGSFDIDIIVESLDGSKDVKVTLKLKEAEPVFLDDLNVRINSATKSLDFTMLPASFDEETFEYYVFVPYNKSYSSVKVFFNAEFDSDYEVECGAVTLRDGRYDEVGTVSYGNKKTFTISVTDEDGNTQEYDVTVFYAPKSGDDDAYLDDLEVKYGKSFKTTASLSPAFSGSTTSYTASVPLNTKSVRVYLDPSDSAATVICGNKLLSGSYVQIDGLKNGANTVKIYVVAEDCDTTKTYTLTINVGSGGLLSDLVFTSNYGTLLTSPAFDGGIHNYVANVANSVSSIYVTPTALDSTYTMYIYAGSYNKSVASGAKSGAIALSEGLNEVKVLVSKSGVPSQTYTLNIYRQPATTKYVVSSQKVMVNGTPKTLYAVNINGNNFLKLRDLAYMLSGTSKQFNVTYNLATNTAVMTSLTAYVNDPTNPVNQPIVLSNPQVSSQKVTLDGKMAYPAAYNVTGSNYVMLRQVCAMLDIGLTYNAASNTIFVTTANGYVPGL